MLNINEVKICAKCELSQTRTQVVIGKGNLNADILFIGEAPGQKEDEAGIPFVGAAGKKLDQLLTSIGLTLNDIYIANVIKCRPPNNRDPTTHEKEMCTPYLIEQIKDINPKVICPLGNHATSFVLNNFRVDTEKKIAGISRLHGTLHTIPFNETTLKVIPLYHPAAAIYNQKLLPELQKDMKKVKEIINNN